MDTSTGINLLEFPMLIYHGRSGWKIERTLGGIIEGYRKFPLGIHKFVPDYEHDITQYTDEDIKGEARVRILFTMFRDVQEAKDVQELLEITDKAVMYLQELDDKQAGIKYFETFMRYIFSAARKLTGKDADKIVQKVEKTYLEGSDLAMTLADILREEGREEGLKWHENGEP